MKGGCYVIQCKDCDYNQVADRASYDACTFLEDYDKMVTAVSLFLSLVYSFRDSKVLIL